MPKEPVGLILGHNLIEGTIVEINVFKNKVISFGRNFQELNDERVQAFEFNDSRISKRHCYIWTVQFDDNSSCIFYLKDVSTNHTFVNGEPIKNNKFIMLNDGDEIEIKFGFKGFVQIYGNSNVNNNNDISKLNDWEITSKILGSGSFGKECTTQQPYTL